MDGLSILDLSLFAIFQPVGLATFVMIALWLGGTGMVGADTAGLFLLGLFLLGPTGIGARHLGRPPIFPERKQKCLQ